MSADESHGPPVLEWSEAIAAPFPDHWRGILLQRVPFYRVLRDDQRQRLEDKVKVFVYTKLFSSAGDLVVTEEMKVVIAATACRLTMNLGWEEYAQLRRVTVRAEAFASRRDGARILGQGGRWAVTVSWAALLDGLAEPDDGLNVGYHEFAHALDGADGQMDGEAPGPRSELYWAWTEVMSTGRAEVVRALRANATPPIDYYAAGSDAEFFAVATEWFFERPRHLQERLPAVYAILRGFYHQDPLAGDA